MGANTRPNGHGRMLILLVLALTTASHVVRAANKYPIVLVHGLGGFGRDELGAIRYWGTLQGDFQEKLKQEGHEVYTVAIGKVSSNWDRACELFAQIKGGRVDYGANHSRIHGHERYGRTYPGLFPKWGTVVDGKVQKIHLIGHSMGGLTSRLMTHLLNQGTRGAPIQEEPSTHELFTGGKDWVHSITTISSPNQGSTLADALQRDVDLLEGFIGVTAGVVGLLGDITSKIYDAQLDQWGVRPKQPGERLEDYIRRVRQSKLFAQGYHDNAGYSLATVGTREENQWVRTQPNVYYYAFVSEGTFNSRNLLLQRIALPNPLVMLPIIYPIATFMGSRQTVRMGFGEAWLPNDGFVNVPSQGSDGRSKEIAWAGRSERGAWMRFQTLKMDHTGMMGTNVFLQVYGLYRAHAALLADLPSHESLVAGGGRRRGLVEGEDDGDDLPHTTDGAIVAAFEHAFATYNASLVNAPALEQGGY